MIECGTNNTSVIVRQQSVERFIKRFNRDIDDPEEINERHIVLRRLILKKFKDLSHVIKIWREATKEIAIDEQRSEIVGRLVTKSFTTVS